MKKIALLFLFCGQLFAQNKPSFTNLTLDDCIRLSLERNQNLNADRLDEQQAYINRKTATEIPKATATYTQGQFNSIYKFDNSVSISQSIPFPSVFKANKKLADAAIEQSKFKTKAAEADIIYQVKVAYFSLQHHYAVEALLKKEDSIYSEFAAAEKEKYAKEKASVLGMTVSENKVFEIANLLLENKEEIINHKNSLQKLLQTNESITVKREYLSPQRINFTVDSSLLLNHPYLLFYDKQINLAQKIKAVERNRMFPEITFGYSNISIYGPANIGNGDYFLTTANRLSSVSAGLNIQLWVKPYLAKIKAMEIQKQIEKSLYEAQVVMFQAELDQSLRLYVLYEAGINSFDNAASTNYEKIIAEAFSSYKKGEINYIDYLTIVSSSLNTEAHHLKVIHQNNMVYLRIKYLLQK